MGQVGAVYAHLCNDLMNLVGSHRMRRRLRHCDLILIDVFCRHPLLRQPAQAEAVSIHARVVLRGTGHSVSCRSSNNISGIVL